MVNPLSLARPRPDPASSLWWITDTVGAIVAALGLAWVIAGATAGHITGFAPFVLLAGGIIRALAQSQAHHSGIAAAIRAQTRWQAAHTADAGQAGG